MGIGVRLGRKPFLLRLAEEGKLSRPPRLLLRSSSAAGTPTHPPAPPPSSAPPRRQMADYPRVDPYKRARYDHSVDAKIVVMGNTGPCTVLGSHAFGFGSRPCYLMGRVVGVGKTSLLHRYTAGKFDPRNTVSTTGAFFVTKKIDVGGVKVRLQLWDTAGQERFRSMVRAARHPWALCSPVATAPPAVPLNSDRVTGSHVLPGCERGHTALRHHEQGELPGYSWLA